LLHSTILLWIWLAGLGKLIYPKLNAPLIIGSTTLGWLSKLALERMQRPQARLRSSLISAFRYDTLYPDKESMESSPQLAMSEDVLKGRYKFMIVAVVLFVSTGHGIAQ